MAAAELDIPQLSSFCSIPLSSVSTLLDAPTAALVRTLLQNISIKAHEYNELQSERLRSNVELEAAVRGQETKNRALKVQLGKNHNEVTDLQQKLHAQEAARASAESELQELATSTSTSTSEIQSLKARIESLESSNRDTLSLLDSKNTAYDTLNTELHNQHEKLVELRRQVSTLEQSLQEKETNISTAHFREENQKQSIAQLERRNEFVENELKAKASEHTKYRKDKSQQIIQLQRQGEEDSTKLRQLQNTETNLRRTLEEVSEKAEERSQKIHALLEESSQKQSAFQLELDAANRLASLRQNSATTERERARDLANQLEDLKQKASVEIGHIQAELETEHEGREAAEARIGELELDIEALRDEIASARIADPPSSTPHRGMNGVSAHSPMHGGSTPQSYSPGRSHMKGNVSVTQLVSDTNDLKRQLREEKNQTSHLRTTIDELMVEMENQSPEIEDMRTEHTRLQGEIEELSSLVDNVSKERDQANKDNKRHQGQVKSKIEEGEALRQQLRDLSSQVKMLLLEAHLRDQDHADISAEGRARLERLTRGDADDDVSEGVTDTDRYISANLVSFRNIVELQEQNSKLLKVTREIGERMEHEEALRKETEASHNWEELQQKYERCKNEMKSLVIQSQSYIRERDMFRQMLAHHGSIPQGSEPESSFRDSGKPDERSATSTNGDVIETTETDASKHDAPNFAKALSDMQAHFDAYRNETATDMVTTKEQIEGLEKLNHALRGEAARSSAQASLAHERSELLQVNYTMLKNENVELQKKSQSSYESAAKQEIHVQQAMEDLVETKGLVESMRNEIANLKAEKDYWKKVEKRINDDNEGLINERGRLNALNASLQSLLNEREHAGSETRRRLQTQVDKLEAELQRTTTSLREETEEGKRISSQRQYEHQQSQKRIDDLVASLGATREELARSTTAKDHLSRQVDEMTIELRSAKERLEVLQSKTVRPSDKRSSTDNDPETQALNFSQEQELSVRVSELQRDLDLSKNETEELKLQIEQYKRISQDSEDGLSSLNNTLDLYREENEKFLAERDEKIKSLEQRMAETSAELATTNTEMNELYTKQGDHHRLLDEQGKGFEVRLAQLKDEHDRHAAAAQFYQQDLKVQASIAQQAQQNYENELVKHADAAKALQQVRGELGGVKLELAEARTEAETARLNLSQSEDSWTDSKERLEREISDLRTARQDLKIQNERLYQQIETLTTAHRRVGEGQEQLLEGSLRDGAENLQEIVRFLRQEKQIVDAQLDLSSQEAKRLKQQVDYVQSQLDDSRLKLSQQRRAEADSERSALDHNKLMETIHDLNTHRESNVTLRAEARQAQAALTTRSKELEDLRSQIEPLQEEVSEMKGEREAHESEVKLLKENADRWQKRAQNVLQKYDRVDPAEHETLKEQVKNLEAERGELLSSKEALREQIDGLNTQINQIQEQSSERVESMKARLTEQFKGRSKTLTDRIREKDSAIQTAVSEKEALEERVAGLSDLQTQLDTAKAERDIAMEKAAGVATSANSYDRPDGEPEDEEGEVNEGASTETHAAALQAVQAKLDDAESKATDEAANNTNLQNELASSKTRIAELEVQITQLQAIVESSSKALSELQAIQEETPENQANGDMDSELNQLREQLAEAQQDAESLRTAATVNASLEGDTNDRAKSVADQVAEHTEAVRKELERRHDERVKQNDENYNKRVDQMRAQLSKKLTEGRDKYRQDHSAGHEKAMQDLRDQHTIAMEQLITRHANELEELRRHEESRFAELKATWDQGHQAPAPTVDSASTRADMKSFDADSWNPTSQEAKAFLQKNEVMKGIVRQNIISGVNKQRDEINARHEKMLAEQLAAAQAKADATKEHAVMMEGKKTALQANLANNKLRLSQLRLEIVQKAAQGTPQKPVKEVWDIVKDAKPPQAPSSQQTQQSTAATLNSRPLTPTKQANMQGVVTQKAAGSQPQSAPPTAQGILTQRAVFDQSRSAPSGAQVEPHKETKADPAEATTSAAQDAKVPVDQVKSISSNSRVAETATATFGQPTPTQPSSQSQPPKTQIQQNSRLGTTQPLAASANPFQRPASSGIPQRQPSTAANQTNTGTGLGALKPLQSGLPVARGGANRGNPRGRGMSGTGRGGPGVDTNRAQAQLQGQASPTGTALNANARQFVPGNKRPRDDSQDGTQGSDGAGKRVRGGGADA